MQIRSKQALRTQAVGVLLTLIGVGALAAPATPHKEKSLVGIQLHASYSEVLRKFGQPTEIQIGDPVATASSQGGNRQGGMGRMPGMGGMGRMPGGMGMMPGGMPGGPGGMMPGGMSGMGRMPGGMGMMPGGMPGGMGGQSLPGMGAQGKDNGGSGLNLPGMSNGSFPGGGMNGLPGLGGMGGRTGGMGGQAVSGNETTWWYHFPKQGLHYSFLFNKQGHVVQIQAYGYKSAPNIPPARTAEGITLGASLGEVIRRYGWSSDGDHSGDYVVLRYGSPDQVAFQSRHNQVIGIVLGDVSP